MPKALCAWQGGKHRQAKWISGVVDSIPHKTYVELFSGPASVFFAKEKSKIEVLNDLDKRFSYIFKALRDCPHEMIKFLKLIEYSRASWDESKEILKRSTLLPRHKLGAWSLYNIFASHSGFSDSSDFSWARYRYKYSAATDWKNKVKEIEKDLPLHKMGAWSLYNIFASQNGIADAHSHKWAGIGEKARFADQWKNKIKIMGGFCRRLKDAVILNHDCFKLLKTVGDRDNLLYYIDPPYITTKHHYKCGEFTLEQHKQLFEILDSFKKASVVISHYNIEPYTSWYKDWEIETKPSNKSCGAKPIKCVEALFIKR